MRRFRFRLLPVLRLRSQLERNSRRELATAIGALEVIERQLAAADRGISDCGGEAARTDAVGRLARGLEVGLRRHRFGLEQQRTAAQLRVDAARAEYSQRARELKTLQKLRDQQHAAHAQEALRSEQAELDELATLARSGPAVAQWRMDA